MDVAHAPLRAYDTSAPETARRDELSFLHAAARRCGWRVGPIVDQQVAISFRCAMLDTGSAPVAILIHSGGAVAAFTAGEPVYMGAAFIDCPPFAAALRDAAWPGHIPSAAALHQDLSAADIVYLQACGAGRGLAYWKPPNLGSVIFNWWD